ncbi:MAG: TIM barrel protein [Spirochaetales bacterium]|nr:TIM barrel protein [Spirochaetales bacterium]
MIIPGLCSISFRKKSVDEIIELTKQAGLEAIEWGGDVHVPHGDREPARMVREKTLAAGLKISSYGSYYRVGRGPEGNPPFEDVLASAEVLGAETIRIWAGPCNREEADGALTEEVLADVRRCARLAGEKGMSLSFEYHQNTFTNTDENAQLLARETAGLDNVLFYWQPPHHNSDDENRSGQKTLASRISNIHVFQWILQKDGSLDRRLLEEGRGRWRTFLQPFAAGETAHYAFLEFCRDDDPANFLKDARVLGEILDSLS